MAFESAGLGTFKTTTKASFSGTLYVKGGKAGFSGTFDLVGNGTLKAPPSIKGVAQPLVVTLKVALAGGNMITGTVSNTVDHWVAELVADKAYSKLNNAPAGLQNTYTMVVPGTPGGGALLPAGDGHLVLQVLSSGSIKLVEGTMGDGAKAAIGPGLVGLNSMIPLYEPLYKDGSGVYHGVAMGWVTLTTTNVYCPNLAWIKEGGAVLIPATYPSGFTNNATTTNSIYSAGLSMTAATITMADGNIGSAIVDTNFTYSAGVFVPNNIPGSYNAKTNAAHHAFTLKADGKGGLSAKFQAIDGNKTSVVKGNGGILQDAGAGGEVRGMFISQDGSQTGSILIHQWP